MKNKMITSIIILCTVVSVTAHFVNGHKASKMSQELNSAQSKLISMEEKYEIEKVKAETFSKELNVASSELAEANQTINDLNNTLNDLTAEEYKLVYLGEHKLTHYCNEKYKHICGNGDGLTSIGTQTIVGKTAAVDPKKIPYGSQIYIEGYGWRTAEDCGSAVKGNQIDILVDTHSEAYAMGVKSGGVWMLIKKS